ncbi:hypothetical protein ACFPYI_00715 [Halomarina salina]|uniref:DUF385 domain-containing protein n=1 Tax=Halomarina salina TaxID=1872699 RepID=A0ABD5RHK2_9EURY|nr:hypothetical protein [Halomarina salina]
MGDSHDSGAANRVSSVQRALEERFANPLLRSVLRSRLHWLASRWLVLVSYVGRRSDRRHTFPVAYHRRDGALVAVTPKRETTWWRNFLERRDCLLWHRGEERSATGEVVVGEERADLLAGYVERHRLLARALAVEDGTRSESGGREQRERPFAVVRFALDER